MHKIRRSTEICINVLRRCFMVYNIIPVYEGVENHPVAYTKKTMSVACLIW